MEEEAGTHGHRFIGGSCLHLEAYPCQYLYNQSENREGMYLIVHGTTLLAFSYHHHLSSVSRSQPKKKEGGGRLTTLECIRFRLLRRCTLRFKEIEFYQFTILRLLFLRRHFLFPRINFDPRLRLHSKYHKVARSGRTYSRRHEIESTN